ncbi:MAG: GTPase HflX, partial [Lutimaribacter sp.]
MSHDRVATRAWVLHPDLKSDRGRRNASYALQEAVSLAAALPGLLVVGAEIVPLPKAHAG